MHKDKESTTRNRVIDSAPYISVWPSNMAFTVALMIFIAIMALPFNYKWTDSTVKAELNTDTAPSNKKTRLWRGLKTRSYPSNPIFWIGGIFYALDSAFGSFARQKPPIWFARINSRPYGESSKKVCSRHRDTVARILNRQTITIMN